MTHHPFHTICGRLPLKRFPVQRKLWIEAINQIQEVNEHCKGFIICIDHFESTQIVNGKLVADAVPSTFNPTLQELQEPQEPQEQNSFTVCDVGKCNGCIQLNDQITQLKKELLKLTVDNDFQRQSFQLKINSLEQNLSEKMQLQKEKSKELEETVHRNEQLQQSLDELKKNLYSNIKGPNVRLLNDTANKLEFISLYQIYHNSGS